MAPIKLEMRIDILNFPSLVLCGWLLSDTLSSVPDRYSGELYQLETQKLSLKVKTQCQMERLNFFRTILGERLRLRGGAEVGKGDPRGIVQEREDGKNVGAWHWEERDMLPFARYSTSLMICLNVLILWGCLRRKQLQGIIGVSTRAEKYDSCFDVSMRISNITRLSGDAVIHLRKGRMWPLCDLQLFLTIEVTTDHFF